MAAAVCWDDGRDVARKPKGTQIRWWREKHRGNGVAQENGDRLVELLWSCPANGSRDRARRWNNPSARHSFLFPACGNFLFAFMNAIALTFQDGNVGVVREPVQQRGDAGGIGKDVAPFGETAIGGDDDGSAFITAIDDFIEKVGGVIVVSQITQFINAKQRGAGIAFQLTALQQRRIALQVIE